MNFLKKEEIIFINRKTIERHGGNFVLPKNLLNETPLDYLIDIIDSEMFSETLYPNIEDKTAVYMFNIISNHIFQDGNKRTGLESALLFLKLNGFQLKSRLKKVKNKNNKTVPMIGTSTTEILIEFTLEIASGNLTLKDCRFWFKENVTAIEE